MSEPRDRAKGPLPQGRDEADGPLEALVVDVFNRRCPSRIALEDVTARWSSLALIALGEGTYRFNALRRRVDGVSEKMLSQALQTLERDGMVSRTVITAIPPRVEYALTPLGQRVAKRLRALANLLEESAADVQAARTEYAGRGEQP